MPPTEQPVDSCVIQITRETLPEMGKFIDLCRRLLYIGLWGLAQEWHVSMRLYTRRDIRTSAINDYGRREFGYIARFNRFLCGSFLGNCPVNAMIRLPIAPGS